MCFSVIPGVTRALEMLALELLDLGTALALPEDGHGTRTSAVAIAVSCFYM